METYCRAHSAMHIRHRPTAGPIQPCTSCMSVYIAVQNTIHPARSFLTAPSLQEPWTFLVTCSFMVLCNLLSLNLFLAVVTSEYSSTMQKINLSRFKKRLAMLDTAFCVFAEPDPQMRHQPGSMAEKSMSLEVFRGVLEGVSRFDRSNRHRPIARSLGRAGQGWDRGPGRQ